MSIKKQKPLKQWSERKIYPLKTERFEKQGNKWVKVSEKEETVSETHYNNAFSEKTSRFFRSIGGYEKSSKTYTPFGLKVYENVSISPDKDKKTIRTVDFEKALKNHNRQSAIYRSALKRRYS